MISYIFQSVFQPYTLMFALAISIAFFAMLIVGRLSKMEKLYLLSCYMVAIFGMLIGAKLLFLVEKAIGRETVYNVFYSGFSFLGGLVGYFVFIKLYKIIYKDTPKKIEPLLLLAIPLIYGIAKVGCYFSGCCKGVFVFPIQIMEATLYTFIFVVFATIYKANQNKKNNADITAYMSLIILCICRFIVDFFRASRGYTIMCFSLTQLICLIIVMMYSRKLYH